MIKPRPTNGAGQTKLIILAWGRSLNRLVRLAHFVSFPLHYFIPRPTNRQNPDFHLASSCTFRPQRPFPPDVGSLNARQRYRIALAYTGSSQGP